MSKLIPLNRCAPLSLALICGLYPNAAVAEWVVTPELSVEAQHSDNFQLFINDSSEDSLILNTLNAELTLLQQTEKNEFSANLGGSYSSYSGARQLNDTDRQFANLTFRRKFERGAFGFSGQFIRDDLLRRPFSSSQLTDPGAFLGGSDDEISIPEVDPNVNLNNAIPQVTRSQLRLRSFVQYRLTERRRLRLGYNFNNRDFNVPEDALSLGVTARDSEEHGVRLQLTSSLSPSSRWFWSINARTLEVGGLDNVETYETRVGWETRLTETGRVRVDVGVARTSGAERDRTGFTAQLAGQQQLSWGTISGSASRSLRPGITGNIANTDTVELNYTRRIAPRWALDFQTQWLSRDQSSSAVETEEFQRFTVGPVLSWSPIPNWELSTAYEYRWIERNQIGSEGTGEDHAILFSVAYRPAGKNL